MNLLMNIVQGSCVYFNWWRHIGLQQWKEGFKLENKCDPSCIHTLYKYHAIDSWGLHRNIPLFFSSWSIAFEILKTIRFVPTQLRLHPRLRYCPPLLYYFAPTSYSMVLQTYNNLDNARRLTETSWRHQHRSRAHSGTSAAVNSDVWGKLQRIFIDLR